jgi:hypothetical protein
MMRIALLLAVSTLHAACSAEVPRAGNEEAAATRLADSAPRREHDRETSSSMSETKVVISSDRGRVTAELIDNEATRALIRMLPVTIAMHDHLRQEKTGNLPAPLPELQRQTEFVAGTLGLWGNNDFVIYYRSGHVPEPGIIVLGRVTGDLAIFENPDPVTVRLVHAD